MNPPPAPDQESTGLPGLRTWGAVYGLVLVVFVLIVVLLTKLTWMFS